MSEDNNRDRIKIEDATITGQEGEGESLDDLSSEKKGKKGKGKALGKGKSSNRGQSKKSLDEEEDDEILGATKEQRENPARQVAVVTGGLSVEQSGIPGSDAETATAQGGIISGRTVKTSQVVLDPRILQQQERKKQYAENEINPAAPPSAFNQAIDVKKIGRKEAYAEGEVNPSAPPNPV